MKKAKKQLGEVGSGEGVAEDLSSVRSDRAEGSVNAQTGEAKSVESMLQEFSRPAGPEAPGPAAARGKYDQLWQLSMADPQTGLANQLLLLDRLTQALVRRRRHGGEVVACHIDLENLGEINLDLGYTTGQRGAVRDGAPAHGGVAGRGHDRPGGWERARRGPVR